jgi:hypothetical protein
VDLAGVVMSEPETNAEAAFVLYVPESGEIVHTFITFAGDERPGDEAAARAMFESYGHPVGELAIARVEPHELDRRAEQRIDPQTGRLR